MHLAFYNCKAKFEKTFQLLHRIGQLRMTDILAGKNLKRPNKMPKVGVPGWLPQCSV